MYYTISSGVSDQRKDKKAPYQKSLEPLSTDVIPAL